MADKRNDSNANAAEQNRTIPRPMALLGAAVLVLTGAFVYIYRFERELKLPPPSRPVPRVQPQKRDYKFGHHMKGPYPFEYEPPVEPGTLANMLSERIPFGTYRLDAPPWPPKTGYLSRIRLLWATRDGT